ncbi:MAG: alpha/beta hydrolase-fold protein [Gaiellaceae bacterium]
MEGRVFTLIAGLGLALLLAGNAGSTGSPPPTLTAGFSQFASGPDGGTVWQGVIPNPEVRGTSRPTVVYVPPQFSLDQRYPVVYLLHGFPGSPYGYVTMLSQRADEMISAGHLAPFIAVIPPAGLTARFNGEWTGVWEDYLVRQVVPWTDAHLPTIPHARDRVVGGLSAGGYGAVDIGLRHPRLFGTLEAWSGTFTAPRDGSLAQADAAQLSAHDPSLLLRREALLVRRLGIRIFLSCGRSDRLTALATEAFARELASVRVPHQLWLGPGRHDGRFWREQLPAALRYAIRST